MPTDTRLTVVFLHSLGSSRHDWDAVIDRLSHGVVTVAIDLPGFGDRAGEGYGDVQVVLDDLSRRLTDLDLARWILVGHSMGGKFATLIAARARDGTAGLSGLLGVVLVAGSPPSPEPMDENRRADMLTWFDDPTGIEDRGASSSTPIPPPVCRKLPSIRRWPISPEPAPTLGADGWPKDRARTGPIKSPSCLSPP